MIKEPAIESAGAGRKRVRTPGKHIVLFGLAVTFMLALSTAVLRSGKVSLPRYELGAATSEEGDLIAPALEFLTDLSPDASGRRAHIRLSMRLVARDSAALRVIRDHAPQIEERVGFFLRELSPEDFAGSEAMDRIKTEILKRASLPLPPDAASGVVIDDLVIQ
jgi:flagellar FliL protein